MTDEHMEIQTTGEQKVTAPEEDRETGSQGSAAEAKVSSSGGSESDEAAPEATEEEGAPSEEEERKARAKWYVIHCYSGMEYKVKRNIETRVESLGVSDRVFDVIVPTEETIELRDGKRQRVEHRVFPGYILVHMIMERDDGTLDEEVWHVVRHTPGVTGFVGIGNRPTPLSEEEVEAIMKRIESEEPQLKVDFRVGERVRIVSGPFADFTGTVVDLYPDKGKARVAVSFFNRETPVEVDFLQLEKV